MTEVRPDSRPGMLVGSVSQARQDMTKLMLPPLHISHTTPIRHITRKFGNNSKSSLVKLIFKTSMPLTLFLKSSGMSDHGFLSDAPSGQRWVCTYSTL